MPYPSDTQLEDQADKGNPCAQSIGSTKYPKPPAMQRDLEYPLYNCGFDSRSQ